MHNHYHQMVAAVAEGEEQQKQEQRANDAEG